MTANCGEMRYAAATHPHVRSEQSKHDHAKHIARLAPRRPIPHRQEEDEDEEDDVHVLRDD